MKASPTRRPTVVVRALSASATRGRLCLGGVSLPCALGRAGRKPLKREGDGASPIGSWRVRAVYYRADRGPRPRTTLPVRRIGADDGWCDAPGDANYNRFVRHPYPASAERLWREDAVYDVIVVLDHNERPRVRGGGSAVFLHVARPGFAPTEGCVAVRHRDLLRLVALLRPGSRLWI